MESAIWNNLPGMEDRVNGDIALAYTSDLITIIRNLPYNEIRKVVSVLEEARAKGKRVFIFGNGGSAATAAHFVCDLSKGIISNMKPRMKIFGLTDNVPLLTAWANDNMYRNTFSEQLENLVEPGDIAIALSGSGESWNVVNGVKTAKSKGAFTIGFTGFEGGTLKTLVDLSVVVPSNDMEKIEDIHLVITHIVKSCLKGYF